MNSSTLRQWMIAWSTLVLSTTWLATPASAAHRACASSAHPSIILHGGQVFTSDEDALWATAIALRGSEILAVGSDAEVLPLAGCNTQLVDLGGRVVIPGLNDAHVHSAPFNPNGPLIISADFAPGPGPTLDEMLTRLGDAASQYPPGTWLYGFVGESFYFDPEATRFALDTVTPEHPVFLVGWTGHPGFINTAAMAALGIAEDASDVLGGWYGRVQGTDVIDGYLYEYTAYRVFRQLADMAPIEDARNAFRAFAATAVQVGLTSIQDMTFYNGDRLQEIMKGLELPIRVRNICFQVKDHDNCAPLSANRPGSRLAYGGFKWVLDGTPIERNAGMLAPYYDDPSWSGSVNFSAAFIKNQVQLGLSLPLAYKQRVMHAFGDRAIQVYFDALAGTAPGWIWHILRPRVEHGDMMTPAQITLARQLGVVVVQNPTHFTVRDTFLARYGAERVASMEPLRSLLEAGVPVAIGSDGLGGVISPFVDLMFAVIHPTHPSEGLTLEQAVIAHTRGSAYAEFQEGRKGTLVPGKLADLAVLSQDIFTAPITALPATYSVMTIVDGQIVFQTGELAIR